MKFNELRGYKSNPVYQQAQHRFGDAIKTAQGSVSNVKRAIAVEKFTQELIVMGFTSHGAGCFATVFSHPDYPWVFKLFVADAAYVRFLNYARQHQDNPYMPKFKGSYMKITPETYVIRMEKLSPIESEKFKDFIERVIFLTDKKSLNNPEVQDDLKQVEQQFPGLIDILHDLADLPGGNIFDLHSGNFMLRGNQLVITDPLVSDSCQVPTIVREDNKFKGHVVSKHYGGYNGRKIPPELKSFISKHTHNGKYVIEYQDSWYYNTFGDKMGIHDFKTFMDVIKPYFSVMRISK